MKQEQETMLVLRVLKKLWGYIKRKRNRATIKIIIKVERVKKENEEKGIVVDVKCTGKSDLIESVTAGAKVNKAKAGEALDTAIESIIKLRRFKATEPEL
jgi:hypothetical protein